MDIKEFKKHAKYGCRFIGQPNKKCMDTTMCNWNKCQKEQQDLANAQLTDTDRESCKNKNYGKEFDCGQKITKKKGLLDKTAALSHCTVNKCPKIQILINKMMSDFKQHYNKKNSKMSKREECMKEHCSKEKQEMDKNFELSTKTVYECEKKFGTYKEQVKCNKNIYKQTNKAVNKNNNCRDKHCNVQLSNNNSKSKIKSKKKRVN